VKRYAVQAQAQGSDTWERIWHTDDLNAALRYGVDDGGDTECQ